MAVFEILSMKEDLSSSSNNGFYNGLLSGLVENRDLEPELEKFFKDILEVDQNVFVCADLPIEINRKTISNQIIRYRDAFKIPTDFMRIPYVLYWKHEGAEKALILGKDSYIEAKGLYFCITEPDAVLHDARNEMVATSLSEGDTEAFNTFRDLYDNKKGPGSIQRFLDRKHIVDVDEMKEKCINLVKENFDKTAAALKGESEEVKKELIDTAIGRAFLIKKAMYVQYMMTKDILVTRHEGEIKKQRQFAKAYVDEIPIVSLSTLWRTPDTDEETVAEKETDAE